METLADLPVLQCASQQQWEDWLKEHHSHSRGAWLRFAKKNSGVTTVSYAEALDSALCYGWIDGQVKADNATFYLQRFTLRRPKSSWSRVNTEHVERLIEAGRMAPAGLRAVEAAKADGRWDAAYSSQSTISVPDDLQAELDRHPAAKAYFETLDKLNRYAICRRIEMVKKPETRRAKVAGFIAMLERQEKPYP